MTTQFLLWIIPPVLYFVLVWFFRKQVDTPHIPRIYYLGTILMFIPIFGMIASMLIISLLVGFSVMGEIEMKKDTKFSKKWLD